MTSRYIVTFLVLYLQLIRPLHAQSWYEHEQRNCEFTAVSSLPGAPSVTMVKNANGFLRFRVQKQLINQLIAAPNTTLDYEKELTESQRIALRVDLDQIRTAPFAAKISLTMAGMILNMTPLAGALQGQGLAWLKNNADAKIRSVDQLDDVVTVGGLLFHQMGFKATAPDFKTFLAIASGYAVQIGKEPTPRRWLFTLCILPVEIKINGAETVSVGPNSNNKRLDIQPDGSFKQWDITDGKYDSGILEYLQQDAEFMYFARNGDNYRIHMFNGPMQKKGGTPNEWLTLYSSIKTY